MQKTTATESCPAKSDGSAHHCFACKQAIAVGASVLDFGRHGYSHYPECPGTHAPGTSARNVNHCTHAGARDLQDTVAADMLADRGITAGAPMRDIGDAVADELDRQLGRATKPVQAPQDDAQTYLRQCEDLGARHPVTGLRPGQDLGDAVAERLFEDRGGYR